jgi:hypothetical protein
MINNTVIPIKVACAIFERLQSVRAFQWLCNPLLHALSVVPGCSILLNIHWKTACAVK